MRIILYCVINITCDLFEVMDYEVSEKYKSSVSEAVNKIKKELISLLKKEKELYNLENVDEITFDNLRINNYIVRVFGVSINKADSSVLENSSKNNASCAFKNENSNGASNDLATLSDVVKTKLNLDFLRSHGECFVFETEEKQKEALVKMNLCKWKFNLIYTNVDQLELVYRILKAKLSETASDKTLAQHWTLKHYAEKYFDPLKDMPIVERNQWKTESYRIFFAEIIRALRDNERNAPFREWFQSTGKKFEDFCEVEGIVTENYDYRNKSFKVGINLETMKWDIGITANISLKLNCVIPFELFPKCVDDVVVDHKCVKLGEYLKHLIIRSRVTQNIEYDIRITRNLKTRTFAVTLTEMFRKNVEPATVEQVECVAEEFQNLLFTRNTEFPIELATMRVLKSVPTGAVAAKYPKIKIALSTVYQGYFNYRDNGPSVMNSIVKLGNLTRDTVVVCLNAVFECPSLYEGISTKCARIVVNKQHYRDLLKNCEKDYGMPNTITIFEGDIDGLIKYLKTNFAGCRVLFLCNLKKVKLATVVTLRKMRKCDFAREIICIVDNRINLGFHLWANAISDMDIFVPKRAIVVDQKMIHTGAFAVTLFEKVKLPCYVDSSRSEPKIDFNPKAVAEALSIIKQKEQKEKLSSPQSVGGKKKKRGKNGKNNNKRADSVDFDFACDYQREYIMEPGVFNSAQNDYPANYQQNQNGTRKNRRNKNDEYVEKIVDCGLYERRVLLSVDDPGSAGGMWGSQAHQQNLTQNRTFNNFANGLWGSQAHQQNLMPNRTSNNFANGMWGSQAHQQNLTQNRTLNNSADGMWGSQAHQQNFTPNRTFNNFANGMWGSQAHPQNLMANGTFNNSANDMWTSQASNYFSNQQNLTQNRNGSIARSILAPRDVDIAARIASIHGVSLTPEASKTGDLDDYVPRKSAPMKVQTCDDPNGLFKRRKKCDE